MPKTQLTKAHQSFVCLQMLNQSYQPSSHRQLHELALNNIKENKVIRNPHLLFFKTIWKIHFFQNCFKNQPI